MILKMACDLTPIYQYLLQRFRLKDVTVGSSFDPDGGEALETLDVAVEQIIRAKLSGDKYSRVLSYLLGERLWDYSQAPSPYELHSHVATDQYFRFTELVNELSADSELKMLIDQAIAPIFYHDNGMQYLLKNCGNCIWCIYGES